MYAEREIQGEEVIGRLSQALNDTELRVLVALADGESPNTIGNLLGIDSNSFRFLERNIKAKLGAKTQPHMMSRAFTLGVLIPRALCLLLSVLCATEHVDDGNRNQTRRGGRTAPASRLARASVGRAASGPGDHHESARMAECFQMASALRMAS